jgi:TfoX/Sxy family transcriptional regulator of competence genes
MAPEALFEQLVGRFSADPSVEPPGPGGKFGASGLKVEGKLFAMLSKGELVLKLPRQRVEQLVTAGIGRPFDPGHGRLMKEWVTIAPRHGRSWGALAEEARQFVATAARRSPSAE